jgi:hypothetical protein
VHGNSVTVPVTRNTCLISSSLVFNVLLYLESKTEFRECFQPFNLESFHCPSPVLSGYLDFVNRLFNKIKISLSPGLKLAQPGGPASRVSVFTFYLKTEEDPASETL